MAEAGQAPEACAGCSDTSPIIYRGPRALCGSCFEDFLLRKFMRSMRIANVRTGDALVLGLSNGMCSAVLADLFAKSVRPRDQLQVTTVFARGPDDADFERQPVRPDWRHVDVCLNAPGVVGPDARREWRRAAVLNALSSEADRTCSRIVLIGDCSERLATNMLACAASGGRALGAVDRCQESSMIDGVMFVRPLHLITRQQIGLWAQYRGLAFVAADDDDGLHALTERFLSDLQSTFPSCVSNVIRTTAKLVRGSDDDRCDVCRDPLGETGPRRLCRACLDSGFDLYPILANKTEP